MTTRISLPTSSRPRNFAIGFAMLLGMGLFTFPSQSQPAPAPGPQTRTAFEVALVRECPKDHGYTSQSSFPANRLAFHSMTLQIAIAIAFDHASTHISGPDWLNDQCYNIDAKVEGDKQLSREDMQPLLQNLLQERFHLVLHHETKTLSGYALVVAKNSPRLHPSKEDAEPHIYTQPDGIDIRHAGVASLAFALTSPGAAGGPIIDKTGIQGDYDITLHYATV